MDIKQALRDGEFRKSLPAAFEKELLAYLSNPSCPCNIPLYRKILKECKEQLQKFFPDKKILDEIEEIKNLAKNHFSVINCGKDELERKLHALAPGRKQIAIARHEDQVTVIVNELDYF
jgi:hypothetical protein